MHITKETFTAVVILQFSTSRLQKFQQKIPLIVGWSWVPREGWAPEKNSRSFEFCLKEGGGLPKFFVHFSQTVYIGSIWGWGGRGRPLPKYFGTLALKKVVQVVQIRGGGRGNNVNDT